MLVWSLIRWEQLPSLDLWNQVDFDFPDRSAEQVDAIGFDCRAGSIKEMEIFHDRMLTEKSPFERMMEVGEQFLPRRVLWGLLPEALLLVFFSSVKWVKVFLQTQRGLGFF